MKAIVVAGGTPEPTDAAQLAGAAVVIGADAGATWLVAAGRRPDAVVGDLDSIDPGLAARLAAEGTHVDRHPTDKDATDTELALGWARRLGSTQVTVLGAFGGPRPDHELANVLLLTNDALRDGFEDLRLVRGDCVVRAVRGPGSLRLEGPSGAIVSLIPIGSAAGVTTSGLRFPLSGERLDAGSTRGISNVVTKSDASVRIDDGLLLVVEIAGGEET